MIQITIAVLTDELDFFQRLREGSPDSHILLVQSSDRAEIPEVAKAIILDGRHGLSSWRGLLSRLVHLPILVVCPSSDWQERRWLATVEHVFVFPVNQNDLIELAVQALERWQASPRMTLVSEDQELVLNLAQQLGPRLTSFSSQTEFWASLEEDVPDILLLDLNLSEPATTLACALRQDYRTYRTTIFALQQAPAQDSVSVEFDAAVNRSLPCRQLEQLVLKRFRRSQAIRRLIDNDPMTGLVNRRRAKARLAYLLRLARRQRVPLALAMLDLDHFKNVNDTYGHATGDRVIKRLARFLRHSFRIEDIASRIGGEEFLVAMYGATDTVLTARLEQLLKAFSAKPFRMTGQSAFHVTFSAGVVEVGSKHSDFQSLYEAADVALYRAKELGRNRVFCLDREALG